MQVDRGCAFLGVTELIRTWRPKQKQKIDLWKILCIEASSKDKLVFGIDSSNILLAVIYVITKSMKILELPFVKLGFRAYIRQAHS
jgi:hypothetical protein